MQRFIAAILAVCVPVCCCQAHFFVRHAAQGDTTIACASDTVDACCARTETDSKAPDDSRRDPGGCKDCCIKGTGQKDAGTIMVAPRVVAHLDWTVVAHAAPVVPRPSERRLASARRGTSPPTLLHLGCALVV